MAAMWVDFVWFRMVDRCVNQPAHRVSAWNIYRQRFKAFKDQQQLCKILRNVLIVFCCHTFCCFFLSFRLLMAVDGLTKSGIKSFAFNAIQNAKWDICFGGKWPDECEEWRGTIAVLLIHIFTVVSFAFWTEAHRQLSSISVIHMTAQWQFQSTWTTQFQVP